MLQKSVLARLRKALILAACALCTCVIGASAKGSPDEADSPFSVHRTRDLWPGRLVLKRQAPEIIDKVLQSGAAVLREITHGKDAMRGTVRAIVLFEQDANTVFDLLIQTDRQDEYLPVLQTAKTVKRYASGNLDQNELEVLFVDLVFRVRHRWDAERRRLWWSLDTTFDNDLRKMEGSWTIYPLEADRSIGEYVSRIDVGRLVPDFVQELLTRRDLHEALHAQRTWINSGGTFRKDG